MSMEQKQNKQEQMPTLRTLMPNVEFLESVAKKIQSQGLRTTASEVQQCLAVSEKIENAKQKAQLLLIDIAQAYYGVNPDNIGSTLITGACERILDLYKGIRLSDLTQSYRRKEITKRKGVGLSISELIEPIAEWWVIRSTIRHAQKENELKELEAFESKKMQLDFEEKAVQVYNDSLKLGEWRGDVFQATYILSLIDFEIDEMTLEEMEEQAERHEKSVELLGFNSKYFGMTKQRIFNELKIIEAIKQGVEWR